ncbi:MAG TPA: hypothetical protein VFR09_08635 [Alphaproteobacteria bacterium]|nr:hypothetical protein [Alphaproteobacteria bacterium]
MTGTIYTIREPNPSNVLGHLLWRIALKDRLISVQDLAGLLDVYPQKITDILRGRKSISVESIVSKEWKRKLAEKFPDTWPKNEKAFNEYVLNKEASSESEDKKGAIPEPKDKTSIGHVLWQIFKGTSLSRAELAALLDIEADSFNRILAGNNIISSTLIINKKWECVLAENFPETWPANKIAFGIAMATLNTYSERLGPETAEADDFGNLLWRILGGPNINRKEAAQRLSINPSQLSGFLHNNLRVTQQTVINKNWRDVFAEHYSEDWKKHEAAFEAWFEKLPKGDGRPSAEQPEAYHHQRNEKNKKAQWRAAVAEFVARIFEINGGEVGNILPNVRALVLRKERTWQRVLEQDATLSLSIYLSALNEVCNVYDLKNRPGNDFQTARRLNEQYNLI